MDSKTFSGEERREWDRLALDAVTSITLSSGARRYHCRIDNLSLAGMKLRLAGDPPPEGPVTLEHAAAGRFAAEAVWHGKDFVGVRFCDPASELERALRCVSLIINPDAPQPPL